MLTKQAVGWIVFATLATSCKREPPRTTTAPGERVAEPRPTADAAASPPGAGGSASQGATSLCDADVYRAPPGDSMSDLTQTATMVLWRERRGIVGWPKSGGAERVIIDKDRLKAFAADEQYLYFAQETGDRNGVFRVPIAGGEPERMAAIGGMFGLIDELKITSTHLIMSRGMGELVRISKSPPFAQQVYSRRDQRRNGFGAWAVSEHAAWFGRPSRGLADAGWARLDFESGALTTIAGPVVGIFASGTTALLVRGSTAIRVSTDAREREHKLYVINEGTGAVEATPWWTGEPAFGFAVDGGRVAFSTIVEAPANGLPVRGWLHGSVGDGPLQRFVTCPRGTSLVRAPLRALIDGDAVFVHVSDNSNRHSLVRIQRGS